MVLADVYKRQAQHCVCAEPGQRPAGDRAVGIGVEHERPALALEHEAGVAVPGYLHVNYLRVFLSV